MSIFRKRVVQKEAEGEHRGIRPFSSGIRQCYLVYLNNQEPGNESLKNIDLYRQKTAP